MNWLRTIGRMFGIVGTALSVKRWWETVRDRKSPPGARLLAMLLIALTIGLIIYSWRERQGVGEVPGALREKGQLIVDFRDDTSLRKIQALAQQYGVEMVLNSIHAGEEKLVRVEFEGDREEALLKALRENREVEFAEPNFLYQLPEPEPSWIRREGLEGTSWSPPGGSEAGKFVPNDPRYREQWHLRLINMEEAWAQARGRGVVVAVIDTGVAGENYKEFKVARDLRETRFAKGYNFVGDNEHPVDDHGHGTHVAGTIAQSTNNREGVAGVAFEATIMPLKVLTKQGFGNLGDIADAIRYAADEGAQVINMSLGGPTSSRILKSACEYAEKKGVTIVCAAGNEGRERVSYPAAYPSCLAVAAVGPEGHLAPYSSYGKELCLAAPGGDMSQGAGGGVLQNTIINGRDDYYFFQGTSMASPHVAGVAALVVGCGVEKPQEVRRLLEQTAVDKGDRLRYGAGLVNAAEAVSRARVEGRSHAETIPGTLARKGETWGWAVVLWVGFAWWWRRQGREWKGLTLRALIGGIGGALVWGWLPGFVVHNVLIHSALVGIGWGVIFWGAVPWRPVWGGLCLGLGAHFLSHVGNGGSGVGMDLWMMFNAAVAILVGNMMLRKG